MIAEKLPEDEERGCKARDLDTEECTKRGKEFQG
jgi:hypothetical protein